MLVLGLVTVAVFFHLAWLSSIDVWRVDRDWRGFFRAGELLLTGDPTAIYQPRGEAEYPAAFVYPPPMLWPFMLLAWMGPPAAYLTLTASSIVLLAVITYALGDLLPSPARARALVALATVATAPWMTMLFVGQLSMISTTLFVLGFVAWSHDRDLLAGLLFGALLYKPTLAFAPPLLALATGRWRVLAGMGVTGVALVLVSLPLGVDLWAAWGQATAQLSARLRDHTPLWKHTTLYAFWRATLGGGSETPMVRATWLVGSAVLVAVPCALLARQRDLPVARVMTLAALLTATVTPYQFYYDQLILLPAAAAWYLGRGNYRRPACWRIAGGALAACCLAQYTSLYILREWPPLAGLCNTIWFGAELWDLRRG